MTGVSPELMHDFASLFGITTSCVRSVGARAGLAQDAPVGVRASTERLTAGATWGVERCVGRLKQWRSVATRYEKRAVNYRAMVVIASLMMWLPS